MTGFVVLRVGSAGMAAALLAMLLPVATESATKDRRFTAEFYQKLDSIRIQKSLVRQGIPNGSQFQHEPFHRAFAFDPLGPNHHLRLAV